MKLRKPDSRFVILFVAITVLLVVVVYPLIKIVIQSFEFDDAFSVKNYIKAVTQRGFLKATGHTFEIALWVTLFSTGAGTILAWIAARTNVPLRKFFRSALVFPFIIPPFIGAVAWKQLLGPVGLLNGFWKTVTGSQEPLWNMYGPDGIILVMTIHLYPFVYLTVLRALDRMNPELEEAAQISGSRPFSVMGRITLPLTLPAVASGASLVFIAAVANFGIPAVLGFPENYYVLTTQVFAAVTRSAEPNSLSLAASLSVILALIASTGLLLQRFIIKGKDYTVISGKSMQPNRVKLGPSRGIISGAVLVFILFAVAAPLIAILLTALTKTYGLPPVPGNWTLDNFYHVLIVNRVTKRAIRNSLFLAVTAATAVSVIGALIAYLVVRTKIKGRSVIDFVSNMPYAMPGTVVAVAMILAWLRPVAGIRLYNTIWILLIAYSARYLAFGVRSSSAALAQVHISLEEAARISGAGWLRSFKDVVIPLIKPGLVNGWFLVFMPALRELTISALLWSSRNETIGVMVFNLQEAGDVVGSAALAAIMMFFLIIANILTRKFSRGRLGV
ncbi:MAG: ABC transporter permease [Spirochaetia bacterium]